MSLINREDLIAEYDRVHVGAPGGARKLMEDAPTVEPERKPGHWIIYTVSMFDGEDCKCSECGQTSCAPYWNFCPNCGADMRGEQNESD